MKTLFAQANVFLRQKEYAAAIELYEKALEERSALVPHIQFNMRLAQSCLASLPSDVRDDAAEKLDTGLDSRQGVLEKPAELGDYYFDLIKSSELFDVSWYLTAYHERFDAIKNPLEHYLEFGVQEGLNPSQNFDTLYYLKSNPDVAAAGVHPFIHYVTNGQSEGRRSLPYNAAEDFSRYEVAEPEYIPKLSYGSAPVDKAVRVICFYLPQFHAIPENNAWWGQGFTEWTNVKPATPQFEGHYQPHVPDDYLGYYNLLDNETQGKQVELAKQYGIEGFCFYLYWFSGKRLLEQPVDNYLSDLSLDLPFCVCWANENWSRRWDGLDQDLLIAQNYSSEDDLAFISHIAKYLRDSRYIRIDGKPLLLVYRPNLFPDMKATVRRWRDWCLFNGVGDIYLAYPQSFECVDPGVYGFDAAIEFPPNNSNPPNITSIVSPAMQDFQGNVYDWRMFIERSEHYEAPGYTLFRAACPSWDNTARKKNRATVFHNSCPKLFTQWLANAFTDTLRRIDSRDEQIVFVNAWNEWAEGAHLEPDQRYGYAWLQAVRDAHQVAQRQQRRVLIVSHDAHPHGAQYLILETAKKFRELGFRVSIILLDGGRLVDDFRSVGDMINIKEVSEAELTSFLRHLRACDCVDAIASTVVCGSIVPQLKEHGFRVLSLIHEMPGVIRGMGQERNADIIAQAADKVVFPAQKVADLFTSC